MFEAKSLHNLPLRKNPDRNDLISGTAEVKPCSLTLLANRSVAVGIPESETEQTSCKMACVLLCTICIMREKFCGAVCKRKRSEDLSRRAENCVFAQKSLAWGACLTLI